MSEKGNNSLIENIIIKNWKMEISFFKIGYD
jgi:hypothetical protein